MKQALGLVEIEGLSTAIAVADAMVKAANIRIIEIENTRGLGYMTIKAAGDVGAVNAAVNVGRQVGMLHQRLVSFKVIPRPSDYVDEFFVNPEDRKAKPEEVKPEPTEVKPEPAEAESAEPEPAKAEAESAEPAEPAEPAEAKPELKKAETRRTKQGKNGKPDKG